jgi:DNA-binding GntR family transcriptional regulator
MREARRALRHDIRDGLVRGIISGEIAAGERIVEMHLAREYGTSQGPVREALRELEVLGFVVSEPHHGTYVRAAWQDGMLELFELRAALEELATRRATPALAEAVAPLQAEVDALTAAAERGDAAGVIEHSEAFHRLVIEASGNHLLASVWSGLGIGVHTELTVVALPVDLLTVAVSHQPIVDAIASGDVELACRVSREHQEFFEQLLAEPADDAPARVASGARSSTAA